VFYDTFEYWTFYKLKWFRNAKIIVQS
jgi:hypothetical protein